MTFRKRLKYIVAIVAFPIIIHTSCNPGNESTTEAPEAVTELAAIQNGADVDLTWDVIDPDNVNYFRVERNGVDVSGELTPDKRELTDVSPAAGDYDYVVFAGNSVGETPCSPVSITVVEPVDPPATPANSNGQVTNEQAQLFWDDVADEDNYVVQRTSVEGDWSLAEEFVGPQNSEGLVDASVVVGETYWYRVAARKSGVMSAWTLPIELYIAPNENPEATAHLDRVAQDGRTVREILTAESFGVHFGTSVQNIEEMYDVVRQFGGSTFYFDSKFENQSGVWVDYSWINSSTTHLFEDTLITGIGDELTLWYTRVVGSITYLYIQSGEIDEDGDISFDCIRIVLSSSTSLPNELFTEIHTPQP